MSFAKGIFYQFLKCVIAKNTSCISIYYITLNPRLSLFAKGTTKYNIVCLATIK